MTVQIVKRPFTVDEYYAMGRAGILSEDDRVELIDGEILQMSPIGRRHAACVDRLAQLFFTHLTGSAIVRVQNPVRLNDHSEPEPDIALLHSRPDFYASGHPRPTDVLLIVEVAETSVDFDREVKVPRYATAGIQEVWLIDLSRDTVEVHRRPSASGYEQVQTLSATDRIAPLRFPQLELDVDQILI